MGRLFGAVLVALSTALSGCSSPPDTPNAPPPAASPAPTPPAPEPQEADPTPALQDPDPVFLEAMLQVGGGGVFLTGATNLPDGALLYFEVGFGDTSGCLTDDCRQFEELSSEQFEVYSANSGSMEVAGGLFSGQLEGWETLPVCNFRSAADWLTEAYVFFVPDRRLAAQGDRFPAQPEAVYALYGDAGERVSAVPPAEVVQLLNPAVRVFAECMVE